MKLTKKILREYKLINSYDIARKLGNPFFLAYSPVKHGRAYRCATWSVHGLKFLTNPDAPWYDHGRKTFNVFRKEEKEPKLQEAVTWVKETYGVEMTDLDVHGSYHPAGSLDKLKKILKDEKTIS